MGEKRITNHAPVGISLCPELDVEKILADVPAGEGARWFSRDAGFLGTQLSTLLSLAAPGQPRRSTCPAVMSVQQLATPPPPAHSSNWQRLRCACLF